MSQSGISQLEQDTFLQILSWVEEVVEGKGASLAQMMVSTVLGLIPFVGQAVDAYNILRGLYHLTRTPDSNEHWLDLVLSLIALVPGFGDALKNVCHMLRHGKAMGRILDSLPRHVRGDIETWFRTLDWARYTAEMVQNLDAILQGLINMLSRSLSSWALGRKGVQQLITQLSQLQAIAGRKLTEAMDTLKRAHQKSLADPLPSTTARTPAAPGAPKLPAPNSQASGNVATPTAGTRLPAQGRVTAQQRQSERSTQRPHQISVSGEHITDYYFVKRQRRRSKINHNGKLYEMSQPGHRGIDHVWHSGALPLGYWGEVLTVAAQAAGLVGLVIDGGVRDIQAIETLGFPVFARGVSVKGTIKATAPSVGQPMGFNGAHVAEGDWVVADDDGIVIIPQGEVARTLTAGLARFDKEARLMAALREGHTTVELMGLKRQEEAQ